MVEQRIVESLNTKLEGTHKHQDSLLLTLHRAIRKSSSVLKFVVQMLLEFQQASCNDYSPSKSFPGPVHPLNEESFPKTKPVPPLM